MTVIIAAQMMQESLHALLKMSEAVQCPLWNFRLQGKKDKVGITLQQVSVKNVHPQRSEIRGERSMVRNASDYPRISHQTQLIALILALSNL